MTMHTDSCGGSHSECQRIRQGEETENAISREQDSSGLTEINWARSDDTNMIRGRDYRAKKKKYKHGQMEIKMQLKLQRKQMQKRKKDSEKIKM